MSTVTSEPLLDTDETTDRLFGPWALAITAAAGPLWPTWIGVQQLQVGRLLVVLVAIGVAFDLLAGRARPMRPRWAAAWLLLAVGALVAWTGLSAATRGCFCGGAPQGQLDALLLLAVASVVMLYAPPRLALVVVACSVAGIAVAGLLALGDIRDLHANVYTPSASSDRLEGVYGNPNYLGYALALAVPATAVGTVLLRGPRRWITALVGALCLALLVDTYSRGALLSAGVGGGAALLLTIRWLRRPRTLIATAVAIPLLLGALIASPFYRDQRVKADFGSRVDNVARVDYSGWDTNTVGPIHVAGGRLSNPPGTKVLRLTADTAFQGAKQTFSRAFTQGRWTWTLDVSSPAEARRAYLHWQVRRDAGPAAATGRVAVGAGRDPGPIAITYDGRPAEWLYLVLWVDRPTVVDIQSLVTQGQGDEPAEHRTVGLRLLGTSVAALHDVEGEYVESRTTALRLAGRAFRSSPVLGIGMGAFPVYADEHADFGKLPTHNAYAQVAAELGAVGIALLLVTAAAFVLAIVRGRHPPALRAFAVATAICGAANLVFINGLSAPGNMMPLLLALAVGVGWVGDPPAVRRRGQAPPEAAADASTPPVTP